MNDIVIHDLEHGDVIRHKRSSGINCGMFIVTANYGDRVTAVSTVDVTNPPEWELVSKVTRTIIEEKEEK